MDRVSLGDKKQLVNQNSDKPDEIEKEDRHVIRIGAEGQFRIRF